nr:hypothetical protein [Tanacetum cinerariifolium]
FDRKVTVKPSHAHVKVVSQAVNNNCNVSQASKAKSYVNVAKASFNSGEKPSSKDQGITSIAVNGKNAYELKRKFLDDLHKNGFSGTNGEDAVEHIEYFLKIVDPIDLPNVNQDKLRVVVFPISLVRGNLYVAYIIGNSLHYQDYEWYEALEDEELKEEALRNKAIMEGTLDDDDEQEIYSNETHELSVCNIRRFEMIKYSFEDDKETSLKAKKSPKLVKYQSSGILVLYKVVDIATCLVKVCKVWDDWEVDRYENANLVDGEVFYSLKILIVTLNNVTYAIRVRELCSWMPMFVGFIYDFSQNKVDDDLVQELEVNKHNLDDEYPPILEDNKGLPKDRFTPSPTGDQSDSIHKPSDGVSFNNLGFSMLERLEETIKVGLALGLNMEGYESILASLVAEKGEFNAWGNTQFDFASTSARGKSDGAVQIRWIVVYAPQPLSSKISLWSPLSNLIGNWDGVFIMLGDFNKVREAGERHGLVFNETQADISNEFIADASLIDIPLGGYNFAWIGIVVEKGIPDHRPILLKEFVIDYDPTPFRLISFKKKLQNLKQVIRNWVATKKVESQKLQKDHQHRLSIIDAKVDKGDAIPRFQQPVGIPPSLDTDSFTPLSSSQCEYLEHQISQDEIKRAVWDCGGDRMPGSNGFTFKFFTTFWDLIEDDVVKLANRLRTVIGSCISSVQSNFIQGRNILDGPYILNEVLSWYLDLIEKLGFGLKWRSWINGCLRNARFSVLVNGSPMAEFELFKGLRQGDPLSYFLFILAIEGLHALTCKAEELGLIKGATIGRDNMNISHLMYDDDVIFFDEWSWCSWYFVLEGDASYMANIIGCGVDTLPLKYLGVPVGCNMTRCLYWNDTIQKFSSKLTLWKARLLSVGGRLSLIKSVLGNLSTYYMSIFMMMVSVRKKSESVRNKFFIGGDQDEKKMTWVKWKTCLASKKHGGLDIGSIFGLNIGLLFMGSGYSVRLWVLMRKIENGESTRFWNDVWCGISPLKVQHPCILLLDTDKDCFISNRVSLPDWYAILRRVPRGGAEMSQFVALQAALGNVSFTNQCDSWKWSIDGSGGFSVVSVRSLVDHHTLDMDQEVTRWNSFTPIKVNVFLWRLKLNKLPSRVNLDRKGIKLDSMLCLICHGDVEAFNHIFFNCDMAKDLWSLLASCGI